MFLTPGARARQDWLHRIRATGGGLIKAGIVGTTTLTAADTGKLFVCKGGPYTITLWPNPASTVQVAFVNGDAGTITIAADGVDPDHILDSAGSHTSITLAQGEGVWFGAGTGAPMAEWCVVADGRASGGGSPGGSNTQAQYNNSSAFAGAAGTVYDSGSTRLCQVAGTGTGRAKIGGVIFDHFANAGTSGTGETDLYSDTIPASTLAVNGDKLRAKYAGTYPSYGGFGVTQDISVYFGGTQIFDSGSPTNSVSGQTWQVDVLIIRVSATVVRCTVTWVPQGGGQTSPNFQQYTEVTGLTLSNTNILKITGTAGSGTLNARMGTVEWLPAA